MLASAIFRNVAPLSLLASFLFGTSPTNEVRGDDAGTECTHPLFLREGLRDARLKIKSGVFEGTGHVVRQAGADGAYEGDLKIFCAFDYDKGLLRSDRSEPILLMEKGVRDVRQAAYKSARTPEKCIVWDRQAGIDSSHFVSIQASGAKHPLLGQPYDFRTFGLFDWSAFESEFTLDTACNLMASAESTSMPGDDGSCVLRMLLGEQKDIERKVWIKPDHGFIASKSEARAFHLAAKQWSDVLSKELVEWEKRADVWVPVHISLERNFNGKETLELDIKWQVVNKPVPSELFELKGMKLAPEDQVVDHRLGEKPVILGQVKDLVPHEDPENGATSTNGGRNWMIVIVLNVVVALGVLSTVWRFLRRA